MESKQSQKAQPHSAGMAVEFREPVYLILKVAFLPRGLRLSCLLFSQGILVLGVSCYQGYSAGPAVQPLTF